MHVLGRGVAAGLAALVLALSAGTAHAADELTIDHVEPAGSDDALQLLVSVPPGSELTDLAVTIDGEPAEASAELIAEAGTEVRRTTVLAIDTSRSMRGERFTAAKAAATQFLDGGVPEDVYVGIVTFDGAVRTALAPTTDRAAALEVVAGLELAQRTLLYDGVMAAAELTGTEGQRNVLLLSDGANTNATTLEDTEKALTASGVTLDAVTLDAGGSSREALDSLAAATGGIVIPADPEALAAAFAAEAASLASQVQVTTQLPPGADDEAEVVVTLATSGGTLRTRSFAVVRDAGPEVAAPAAKDDESSLSIPRSAMFGGLAAIGVGLLAVLGVLFSMTGSTQSAVEQRIAAYGANPVRSGKRKDETTHNLAEMKDAAASLLQRNRGLEARIEARLEAGGSAFKASEWVLLHGGIALLAALVGLLLGNGSFLTLLLGLAVGLVLPWWWLGFKRKRRVAAFNAGLADTLQLIAGSLSAGMSLAQAMDTVVEEGNEPIAGEFKRVLIETRLGVPLETALEGIAQRIGSVDFAWVVMAIRIQREVGGNLAELLNTVSGTLRERDYLRRQVLTLSAEGRLSAYILIALPIGVLGYLFMVRRDYVMPLFVTVPGLFMLSVATLMLGLGWLMMSRIVKVEV